MITLCPIFRTLFYTKIPLLLKAVNCKCKDPCSLLIYTIEVIPYHTIPLVFLHWLSNLITECSVSEHLCGNYHIQHHNGAELFQQNLVNCKELWWRCLECSVDISLPVFIVHPCGVQWALLAHILPPLLCPSLSWVQEKANRFCVFGPIRGT